MHEQGMVKQIKRGAFLEEVMPDLKSKRQDGVGQAKKGMKENLAAGTICAKAPVKDQCFV